MRVGLYDCDLDKECKNSISIDLLKLAGEYRNKNDIYSLIPTLTNLDLYTKIHYWSDLKKIYLSSDLVRDNLEPGGNSFGIKIPKEIEDVNYSTSLYANWYAKNGAKDKNSTLRIQQTLSANHLRLERDGVPLDYGKHVNPANKLMMIHDKDIFEVKGWQDIFDELFIDKRVRVGFRYPVIIDTIEKNSDLLKYNQSKFYSYRCYDLNCDKETFLYFVETYYRNGADSCFLIAPPPFTTNHEKVQYIRKILSRVIFCQSRLNNFFLSYRENNYFTDEFKYFLMYLLEWEKYRYMWVENNGKLSLMNYFLTDMAVDWQAINFIFNLEPEIKKLATLIPFKKYVSEETLYEPT